VKRALTILLAAALTALCGICLFQWRREADFRTAIASLTEQQRAERKSRAEAESRITALETEIQRVGTLRADAESRYLAAHDELRRLQADWDGRGDTILALGKPAAAPASEGDIPSFQNGAIRKQNEIIKQVAAERDAAIGQLNARTREWNALTEKYNKLAGRK